MNKKIFFLLVSISFVFPLIAQNKTLKIATVAPTRSAWDIEEKRLAQDWAKVTDGKIQMQFMGTSAMGGETGVIQKLNSVRPGQKAPIDGAIFTTLGVATLVPEMHILTLTVPFMFRNQAEVDYVLKTLEPRFQKAFTQKGYVLVGWFNVGWAYFFTKKAAHTPQELKAQKLCVSLMGLPELSNAFKAAGFRTEDVPDGKLLQNLKTPGGVEGFYSIPMYAYAGQYYKATQYILDAPFCPVMAAFVISEKSWNEIPSNYKKEMMSAVQKAEEKFVAAQKTSDAEYLERCVQGGCTLVKLSDSERAVMEKTLNADASAMIKTGLMDQKFYDDIMALLKKYRGE